MLNSVRARQLLTDIISLLVQEQSLLLHWPMGVYKKKCNVNELLTNFKELENDVGFQQAVRTSHGRRPPVSTLPVHKRKRNEA